ncbi:hypothetical protein ACAG96_00855 [Candidatus Izemoplasma sp. B36]|uniref:hypothetical protein n=1 Tax=Candidatus Izemoplasma sp. B36 TaxID=3242468 RepID=UPI0035583A4F
MLEKLKEKYKDMTDEEFEALPDEEKKKIMADIEAEGKQMAEEAKKEIDKLTDEEKAKMKEAIKKSQEYGERTANYTEEEIMAEMMNPETEGYSQADLEAAREFIKNQKEEIDESSLKKEIGDMATREVKRGILYTIKSFLRKLFK